MNQRLLLAMFTLTASCAAPVAEGRDSRPNNLGALFFGGSLRRLHPAERSGLAGALARAGEWPLNASVAPGRTTLRVLWEPACAPLLAVRLQVDSGKVTLHGSRVLLPMRADKERAMGTLEEVWRDVPQEEGLQLEENFNHDAFWGQAELDPNEEVVVDGEEFLVEGLKGERYHVLKRNGRLSAGLRRAIENLVRAAGWSLEWKGC
jgi:hypothetical protein